MTPSRETGERRALVTVGTCAVVLLLGAVWTVWQGLALGSVRKEVEKEMRRDKTVSDRMADTNFREQIAGALKTLSEDDTPLPVRLGNKARILRIAVDGSPRQMPDQMLPNLGLRQTDVQIKLKDVSLPAFLEYACAVEMEIPDTVVTEATLKPVPLAGDRWEAMVTVSRRIKTSQ